MYILITNLFHIELKDLYKKCMSRAPPPHPKKCDFFFFFLSFFLLRPFVDFLYQSQEQQKIVTIL